MGRRATDPMTRVPVLGVPASVGVCSWKTTGRVQKWRQCSVGVQTSQGIIGPPAQTPDTLSNNETQTSNSCITKETKDTFLLTKNKNENRAILKQKTGETKIRKEVTFKGLRGDTSEENGTYCYARRINTNPFIAGMLTSSRIKLKHHYVNGSVVDSDAIGGISVVEDETEPVKGATSHGKDSHNADQLAKMRPLSASQGLAVPQEVCNNSGEGICKASVLRENSFGPDAYITEQPLKPALTSLFTATHFQVPYNDTKLQQNQLNSHNTHVQKTAVNPKILYLDEELRYRKTPHPACPVHSRGKLETTTQPAAIIHAKTPTVKNVAFEPLATLLQDRKITSITLTPQAATATKPNNPHSHTHSKLLETSHLKSAAQATTMGTPCPPPSYVYAVAVRSRQTICANTLRTNTTFNPEMMPSDDEDTIEDKTQINNVIHTTNMSQATPKSLSTNALKSDHSACLTSPQPDPSKSKEKHPSSSPSAGKMTFIDMVGSSAPPNTTAQHSLWSTAVSQSTLNHKANPEQITGTSTKHQSAPISSSPPNCLTSKPTLQISTSSLHKKSNTTQPPDSKSDLPLTYTSKTTCPGAQGKNVAFRSIKFLLKKTPDSLLSPFAERQNSVSASNALQLADSTKVLSCNEAPDTNKAHLTQATGMRHQGSNERSAWDVFYNQESSSRTTPLTSSEPQNVSGNHNKGRNTKLTFNPNVCSDRNKFEHDLINKLVINESNDHEISNCAHLTNTQNCISVIKSSSSSLQACLFTEQQRLTHYHGCTGPNCEGRCATSPPVKSDTDSNAHQFPLGATASRANGELKSNVDRQTRPSASPPSVTTQTKRGPTASHANTQVRCNTSSPACQDSNLLITLQKQTHATPERSVTLPASLSGEGEPCADAGPERGSLSSTMPLATRTHIQPSEVEGNSRADSKGVPQLSTDNASLAHSHPADAALLLPPSLQCCKSAALEQRLRAVEASLAANKDRITTLLNIIHDLETISTPSSRRRSCKTGLDLKSCPTCQKTACIVYSVEYDFRRQERNFLEVLNQSGRRGNGFSAQLNQPLNISLLRNVIIKNLSKTKLKSKKLCKTLLKWLPSKIQQL